MVKCHRKQIMEKLMLSLLEALKSAHKQRLIIDEWSNLTPASATPLHSTRYLNSYSTFDSAQQEGGGNCAVNQSSNEAFLISKLLDWNLSMALQALVAGDPSLIWLSIEHVMEGGKKAISHVVIETYIPPPLRNWNGCGGSWEVIISYGEGSCCREHGLWIEFTKCESFYKKK